MRNNAYATRSESINYMQLFVSSGNSINYRSPTDKIITYTSNDIHDIEIKAFALAAMILNAYHGSGSRRFIPIDENDSLKIDMYWICVDFFLKKLLSDDRTRA